MTVQINDIVRVTAKLEQGGDDIQNVYHVKNVGSGAVADATFLASAVTWMDDCYDYMDALMGDAVDFVSVEAFNITQGAPIGEDSWDTMTSGGDAANQEYAKQCCALIRFPTATAKSQGRKFIGGLTEALLDNGGVLTGAVTTQLGLMAAEILAGFVSDTQDFEVGNWSASKSRWAPWISAIVNTYNAVQRRRAAGVGS